MIGVSLSRWTMSYFATALAALLGAEALMAGGYGFPGAALHSPETLVLVHLTALGWLSMLLCGALFQFVPVLVAKPLHSNSQPLPTLVCLVAGLAALILGFLQLAGTVKPGLPLLPLGGALLGIGFALALWNLGRTLWSAWPPPLPARFVVVGLLGLVAVAAYGIVFTLVLGGAVSSLPMVAFVGLGIPVHAAIGLGGWLTFTAIGVSYRLLAMFMLAPELDGRRTRSAFYLGTGALAVVVIGGSIAAWLGVGVVTALVLAGLLGLAAAILYGADIVHLYRVRRRRTIELNSRMAVPALASLGAVVLLMIVLAALGQLADRIGAVVFLAAFGWLSGLGLSMLYKIVPFLTWLECYGPALGKAETPRVQDLVVERRARKWFILHFLAVWLGTVALLVQQPAVFRIMAAAMLVATVGIVAQLVRARRLADVASERRLPQGTARPHLLVCLARQS
jgi:hypothetical protein